MVFGLSATYAGLQPVRAQSSQEAFELSIEIARPAEDVWNALVSKEIVDSYYFAPLSGDMTAAGQKIFYGSKDQQLISGEVLSFDPPKSLSHSFKFAEEPQAISTVTYTIVPLERSTRLSVAHEGYARGSQHYNDVAGGWPIILERLRVRLEAP